MRLDNGLNSDGNEDDWQVPTIETLEMYKAPGPNGIPNEFDYVL